jgi:chitodextrinase
MAPSVPTTPSAATTGTFGFLAGWLAATDNVAVTTYEVRVNGVSQGTTSDTSFYISTPLTSTSYSVTVRAGDAAGNWSGWSSALTVTTSADAAAPSAIGAVNYASLGDQSVTIFWPAAGDSYGVVGYNIYRAGTLVATTTSTTFVDHGLSASTSYSYVVRGYDQAGNEAASSTTLTVTTTASSSTDSDHDGVPDAIETILGTSTTSAATIDTTNQIQMNVQRPSQ